MSFAIWQTTELLDPHAIVSLNELQRIVANDELTNFCDERLQVHLNATLTPPVPTHTIIFVPSCGHLILLLMDATYECFLELEPGKKQIIHIIHCYAFSPKKHLSWEFRKFFMSPNCMYILASLGVLYSLWKFVGNQMKSSGKCIRLME